MHEACTEPVQDGFDTTHKRVVYEASQATASRHVKTCKPCVESGPTLHGLDKHFDRSGSDGETEVPS